MKKFLTIALALVMMLSVCAFALELDAAESAAEQVEETAVLAGTKGDDDGKPGINLLTGTTDLYGFDDEGFYHARLIKREEGIVNDPADSTNKVMWVGDQQYSNIGVTPIPNSIANDYYPLIPDTTFESTRKFSMKLKVKGTATAHKLNIMSGIGNAGSNGWKTLAQLPITNDWVTHEISFTYAQACSSLGNFVLCYYNGGSPKGDFYIDDVAIIPNYRVAYYNQIGSEIDSYEYVLGTTYEIPASMYEKYEANDKFLGFKFLGDDDSNLITGAITLANEDLDIVPVFDCKLFSADYLSAAEGTTLTITSIAPVTEWSIEDDFAASLTPNGNTATLTAKGYSGAVVVTAKGEGWEESVKVYLKGGTKFRPGVNFGTGTNEPITFEKKWEVYSLGRNTELAAGSAASVDNGTETVLSLPGSGDSASAQNYPQIYFTTFSYASIETDRPLVIEFDFVGNFQNFWPLDFSGKTGSIGGGNSSAWAHYKKTFSKSNTASSNGFQWGKLLKNAVYVDNLALTPYYKVTFVDATGAEASHAYALPADGIYTIPTDKKLANTETKAFAGWATVAGATDPVATVTLKNTDVTLYPVYKDPYNVNYYDFEGNLVKTDMAWGNYTPDYTIANTNDKTFKGWKTESSNTPVTSMNVTADVNLYPIYSMKNATIYVSSTGSDATGDGSESAPYASLDMAYTFIDENVVFVLLDNATLVNPPAHAGTLTIKGKTSSVTLTLPSEVSLAGALKLDNLKLSASTIYANGNAFEITSSVTSSGSLTVFGGTKGTAYTGNTDVKIFGGTYSKIFGGNENAALNGKTNITFGGNAKTEYIFGAGNSANGTATETNVYVTGGTINEAVYGGTHFGTAAANGVVYNITMTGGKTQAIFGGSIGASVNGHVFVNLLGGEVTRRVYTGCYNETSGTFSISYASDYYVTGTTVLTIAPGPKLVTGSDINRGIFSGSRTASQHDAEQNTIIYLDDCYGTYNGKIGEKGTLYKNSFKSHHDYVVQATAGGDVLGTKTAGKVYIAPDEGKWGVIGTNTYCNEEASITASTAITFANYYTVTYYDFDGEIVKSEDMLACEYALDLVLDDENGKYFEGWKLEDTDEIVTSVNVNSDVNLYPVYTDKTDSLETSEVKEIRFDTVDGNPTASIRFKASITASDRNAAKEYGFLVTRRTFLDTMAGKAADGENVETELTFGFNYNGNTLYTSGAAYALDENGEVSVDKITDTDEDGNIVFAAVLTGIKNDNASHVNETMVARPYVKFVKNDKEFVFYGKSEEASLADVAKTVNTTELPENYKKNIEDIVALAK